MILITVQKTEGSAPREAGAWMVVRPHDTEGTLGGGHVEFVAIAYARELLANDDGPHRNQPNDQRFALGPNLGQCCGGIMNLRFEHIDARQLDAFKTAYRKSFKPVALFGGGHVGRALIHVLSQLPYRVTWVDSRDDIFPYVTPEDAPVNITCEHSNPVQNAVASIASGSAVLIMSFSHAEDFEILQACLKRNQAKNDLPFIGLIGSKTKWATFQSRLRHRNWSEETLKQVTCPIGLPHIAGKEPAVIAVSVIAQLLEVHPPT